MAVRVVQTPVLPASPCATAIAVRAEWNASAVTRPATGTRRHRPAHRRRRTSEPRPASRTRRRRPSGEYATAVTAGGAALRRWGRGAVRVESNRVMMCLPIRRRASRLHRLSASETLALREDYQNIAIAVPAEASSRRRASEQPPQPSAHPPRLRRHCPRPPRRLRARRPRRCPPRQPRCRDVGGTADDFGTCSSDTARPRRRRRASALSSALSDAVAVVATAVGCAFGTIPCRHLAGVDGFMASSGVSVSG